MSKEKNINKIDNKEAGIGINNNERIFKYISEAENVSLDFLGLNVAKIKCIATVKDEGTNFVFLLEDDSYLHLKFETTNIQTDILSLYLYDLELYKKDSRPIRTIVIYLGDIKNENVNTELRIGPNAYYKVEEIFVNKVRREAIFEAVEKLEIMSLNKEEREIYENKLKKLMVWKDVIKTAERKGKIEGLRELLDSGVIDIETIITVTGLKKEDIIDE